MPAMKKTLLVIAAALLVASAAWAQAAGIAGKWTATITTQVGDQTYTYTFVVKGNVLTGTAEGNLLGKSEIAEGKVEGDKVSFVENGKYMDMPLRIVYTGTVTPAGEIKFSRNVADIANEEFVAKRAK
jgi:hypothetical protein